MCILHRQRVHCHHGLPSHRNSSLMVPAMGSSAVGLPTAWWRGQGCVGSCSVSCGQVLRNSILCSLLWCMHPILLPWVVYQWCSSVPTVQFLSRKPLPERLRLDHPSSLPRGRRCHRLPLQHVQIFPLVHKAIQW